MLIHTKGYMWKKKAQKDFDWWKQSNFTPNKVRHIQISLDIMFKTLYCVSLSPFVVNTGPACCWQTWSITKLFCKAFMGDDTQCYLPNLNKTWFYHTFPTSLCFFPVCLVGFSHPKHCKKKNFSANSIFFSAKRWLRATNSAITP